MIFLCFSSKDRYDIAESVYYHINNIGIPIWYDRKEILMGNNRNHKNFVEGVETCNYALIILSPNSISSIYANEEIDLIYERYKNDLMYVFPVFYNINSQDLPSKYDWMKQLVYKEMNISTDSRGLCNHVICKYLKDKINLLPYKSIEELEGHADEFINSIIHNYMQVDGENYNARIALLFSAIQYIKYCKKRDLPQYCTKGSTFLFNETKLSLPMDQRETIIFEHLFVVAANHSSS